MMNAAEEILQDLRRVATLLGKDWLSRREYLQHGKFREGKILRTFLSWNEAIRVAGLQPIPMGLYTPATTTGRMTKSGRIDDEALRAEFMLIHEFLGREPTRHEFNRAAEYSSGTYETRFGGWRATLRHYLGGTATEQLALPAPAKTQRTVAMPPSVSLAEKGRRMFGAPLNFRELRHEPIDEQGVVYLFGMVARELGFLVEGVTTAFPDCDAKRLVTGGRYQSVRIEFEFRSRNFREHGHDPTGCDLIVCWEHDWRECPLEVIELKEAIKKLPS